MGMGYCPCFGARKGKKLKSNGDRDVKEQCQLSTTSNELPLEAKAHGLSVKIESSIPTTGTNVSKEAATFTYRELATATKNFRRETLIGEGGFGSVYKGHIESTGEVVAVKKLNTTGLQGDKEFLVEILMLSLLRHPNLVSMIGYCAEGDQRLLVYEYMPLGSLEYHLHDIPPDQEPLDWNTRMMIAAGAAKGLNYLHNEAEPPVIYRDLKSSNILLDEDFNPKLSDFGLAKFGPSGDRSHVSTRVMGTHGYCAPEYATTGKLSMKTDIYSFGVVLLELITGLKALDGTRGHGKRLLVDWARPMLKDRTCSFQLVDPQLRGQFSEQSLQQAVEVASMCLQENANNRPCISDVVLAMNFLTSHPYEPPKEERVKSKSDNYRGERGGKERGRRFASKEEFKVGFDDGNSPKETTKMLNRDSEREQAVAEAKMWAEVWREKRRQGATSDVLNR